jgi:sortase A
VRLLTGNRRFREDPLLKAGLLLMGAALAFASIAITVALLDRPMERAVAANSSSKPSMEPLVRGKSPYEPWVEPRIEVKSQRPRPEASQEPQAQSGTDLRPKLELKPKLDPEPHETRQALPLANEKDRPTPTEEDLKAAYKPRHYHHLPGAIMGLTIKAIGLHNVPVFDSDAQWALDNGVAHVPETSLPWSDAPQRNVYLAGHRLGWPGTGSYLVFYRLNELRRGDEIVLRDREGKAYRYRVTESFKAEPTESWVMGQVVGEDMVTLQTCTPIPLFDRRLIVRAERV